MQEKLEKHREYLTKKVEQNLLNKNGVSLHRMERLSKLRAMIFDLAEQAINELWDMVAEVNKVHVVKTVEVKDDVKGANMVKSVQQRQSYNEYQHDLDEILHAIRQCSH